MKAHPASIEIVRRDDHWSPANENIRNLIGTDCHGWLRQPRNDRNGKFSQNVKLGLRGKFFSRVIAKEQRDCGNLSLSGFGRCSVIQCGLLVWHPKGSLAKGSCQRSWL